MQFNGVGVAVIWLSRESVGYKCCQLLACTWSQSCILEATPSSGPIESELGLRGKMTEGGVVGDDSELGAVEVVGPGAKGMDNS